MAGATEVKMEARNLKDWFRMGNTCIPVADSF